MVDEEDRYLLEAYHFTLKNKRGSWYAETVIDGRTVGIHRIIMGVENESGSILVDHEDQNGLNNRRSNLRLSNAKLNAANVAPRRGCRSPFKGVDFHRGRWRARCRINGREACFGHFVEERDAAIAYDYAALGEFGEHAVTNFVSYAQWLREQQRKAA